MQVIVDQENMSGNDVSRTFRLYVDPGLQNIYHLLVVDYNSQNNDSTYRGTWPEMVLEYGGSSLLAFWDANYNAPENANSWSIQLICHSVYEWATTILARLKTVHQFHAGTDKLVVNVESQHHLKLSMVYPVLMSVAKSMYTQSVEMQKLISPAALLSFCRKSVSPEDLRILETEYWFDVKRAWIKNKMLAAYVSTKFLQLVRDKTDAVLNLELMQPKITEPILHSLMESKRITNELLEKFYVGDKIYGNPSEADWMIAQNLGTVVSMWLYDSDVATYMKK